MTGKVSSGFSVSGLYMKDVLLEIAAKKLTRLDVVLFTHFGKFRDIISNLDTTRSIHFLPKSTPTVILKFDFIYSELIKVSLNKT